MIAQFQALDAHLHATFRACGGGASDTPAIAADDAGFNRLALEVFAVQFAANAPYRALCQARRATPDRVQHWSRVPALPVAALKDFECTCLPPDQRSRVFHSSGTTGQRPSRHFHSADSLALYEHSLWSWFQPHILAPGFAGRLLFLCPPTGSIPHSSLGHMFATVRQEAAPLPANFIGGLDETGAWTIDPAAIAQALAGAVAADSPLALFGTAFSLVQLLDALGQRGQRFALPRGSRVMETGGYKGRSRHVPKPVLYQEITTRLGVAPEFIVGEYGMSELSSQAYDAVAGASVADHLAGRTFRFPPWARVRISSPETGDEVGEGQTGLIQVVDLANLYSVAALQTEDLGIRRGRGFELVGRAALAEARGCSLLAAA
jgi:hypothetical protein